MDDSRLEKRPQPEEPGWLTRERALVLVLIAATVLAVLLCYYLVQPFVPVLAWAVALGIVARPIHDVIASRVRHPEVAAGLAVVVVGLLIVIPVSFVVYQLVSEVAGSAERVQDEAQNGDWLEKIENIPWVGPWVYWVLENFDVRAGLQQVGGFLTRNASLVLVGSVWGAVQLLLVLFTLFFFFRDRGMVLRGLRSLMPLSDKETDEVFTRVADIIHATIYGSLLVALIQGTMGGLMFWLLGLPSPLIWGVVMSLLAVVPNLGTFVVWGPAAVLLAFDDQWGKALILASWGGVAIAMIDNLLYPYLVGHRMRLHTLAVFYALLGGILLLGASGVVLGPVILVITIALVDVWRRRTAFGQPAETGVQTSPVDLTNVSLDEENRKP